MTKENAHEFFKKLMDDFGVGDSWNNEEFDRMFEMFEEDGQDLEE